MTGVGTFDRARLNEHLTTAIGECSIAAEHIVQHVSGTPQL